MPDREASGSATHVIPAAMECSGRAMTQCSDHHRSVAAALAPVTGRHQVRLRGHRWVVGGVWKHPGSSVETGEGRGDMDDELSNMQVFGSGPAN